VPSDAPDDYAALMDIQNKEGLRKKFNIPDALVKDLKPIPIIEVKGGPFGLSCISRVLSRVCFGPCVMACLRILFCFDIVPCHFFIDGAGSGISLICLAFYSKGLMMEQTNSLLE
jgi:hypothetical protein